MVCRKANRKSQKFSCQNTEQSAKHIQSLKLYIPGSFDQLLIDTEDGPFPLNQLAQIVMKNPTLLIIDLASMPQVK